MEQSLAKTCAKKAFEIAYASFRISGAILQDRPLGNHLERAALNLLEAANSGNPGEIRKYSDQLEYLLRLGENVGLVHRTHADMVISEIEVLNAATRGPVGQVAGFAQEEKLPDFTLAGIFSPMEIKRQSTPKTSEIRQRKKAAINPATNKTAIEEFVRNLEVAAPEEDRRVEDRRAKILVRIRQTGNCRLKDILDILPDISERTVRYDLQEMIEEGVVERLGEGPGTSYQIKGFRRESVYPEPVERVDIDQVNSDLLLVEPPPA
ncbi:MAG: DeoR family transcriptional regulator [Patescibacteria group bacterium]